MTTPTQHSAYSADFTASVPTPSLTSDLSAIVGPDHVLSTTEQVERVSRTNVPTRYLPHSVVYPGNADEVQRVVRLAARHQFPVWPVSQGKNWGYGSKSAGYPGGITMVLSRMNRILEVNEDLGYAVLEPGVSYEQLQAHLSEHAPSLWADVAGSTKDASVIGNALDRGRGLTPYADHFGCLCGMEVVTADGNLIRTGGGNEEAYPTWNTYKWGTGPFLDGIFSQSNFGIVVKSGIWLMPKPEKFDFCVFEYTAAPDRFPDFIADLRRLLFQGVLKSHPHLANDFAMLCIVSQYPFDLLNGKPCLSPEDMQMWRRRYGVSDWTFGCGLYGTRGEVRLHRRILKRTLGRYGRVVFVGGCEENTWKGRLVLKAAKTFLRLQGKSSKLLEGLPDAVRLFKGIPTDYFCRQVYFRSHPEKPTDNIEPARDGCGFMWIGPVTPLDWSHLDRILTPTRKLYQHYGFDFFVELIVESPRNMIVLFGMFYDKEDAEESARADELYGEIWRLAYDLGYPPYRCGATSGKDVYQRNQPLGNVVRRIKEALDPHEIIAPGRYCPSKPHSKADASS